MAQHESDAASTSEPEDGTPPSSGRGDQLDQDWVASIARPVLIVIMVSCIDIAIFAFLRQYATGMHSAAHWSIVGMGVAAAIIGCATTTWLALPAQRLRRSAGYRVAEILLMVTFARMAMWLVQGDLPSPIATLLDPIGVFADGAFLLALVTILFTWYAAIDFTDDLMRMALQPDELWLNQRANVRFADTSRPVQTNRTMILRGFVARWVGWGIFLILIASTLRLGITRPEFWTMGRVDVDPLVVGAVLVYFLIGLLLISQGQLAVLRARWMLDRLPTSATVTRNWPMYTMAILLLFGVLSALLPLGDTYLLSVVLSTILNALYALAYLVFRLITVAFLFLLSLLPFANGTPDAEVPPPPVQAPPGQLPAMLDVPPWIGGAFFWLSIILLIGYAAYFYFSDRDGSLRWLRRLWQRLVDQWRALFAATRRWYAQRQPATDENNASQNTLPNLIRRLLPWRLLNPDQRVRLLYFEMLKEAEARKIGRRPSETPDSFAPRLEAEIPPSVEAHDEVTAAVEEITDAFVDVRYAGRSVAPEDADRLRRMWSRLRRAIASKDGEKSFFSSS